MISHSLSQLLAQLQADDDFLTAYLAELLERHHRLEPSIHAFVPESGRFARLRREADALRLHYPLGTPRPPLFGLPVGVKDIFHVSGFTTRAGAPVPPELLQGQQSAAVAALRQAGALIMGKTVTTEFAYFAPGPTRHPLSDALGEDHTPGGSSSGSAAAVAAELCPVALGTQTIGSITRPAAFCGIAGFKPSYGRVSAAGVIPLSPSADTVGFFVPRAADIPAIAAVMVPSWQPVTMTSPPVVGIPTGPYLDRAPEAARDHLDAVADHLATAGFDVRRVPALADFDDIYSRHNQLVAAEAAAVHAEWFAAYGNRYHPKTAELIRRGQAVTAGELAAALAGRDNTRAALHTVMNAAGIDLWLSPAALGPAPRGLNSTGDPVMNLPWTHAGLPTVALPAGRDGHGRPLGVQLAGRFGADEALVAAAIELEATQAV
jgi:Asp-tRNA(Asn)/Glu-tRNA(Gln) amidotransferase A subunit family amidase